MSRERFFSERTRDDPITWKDCIRICGTCGEHRRQFVCTICFDKYTTDLYTQIEKLRDRVQKLEAKLKK